MEHETIKKAHSNYVDYALNEFMFMGWLDVEGYDDEMQETMCKSVIEMLETLHNQHFSGGVIDYALRLFLKLAQFRPLGPLTGKPEEWRALHDEDRNEPELYQNIRFGSILMANGRAYNNRARLFKYGEDGATFQANPYSREFIEFPYVIQEDTVVTIPIEYKEGGIDTVPDEVWAELGITIQREAP